MRLSRVVFLCFTGLFVGFAQAENVLRWAAQGDAISFDPHAFPEATTFNQLFQVYEALLRTDNELQLQPALAESWDSLGPNVWRFRLRSGVRFHDGSPLTAADVVFSLKRAAAKPSGFHPFLRNVTSISAPHEDVVRVVTAYPQPVLPNVLALVSIMNAKWAQSHQVTHSLDFHAGEESFANRHANGTGPFVLLRREPDLRTVMTKNEAWWGLKSQPHNIDRLVFTPISNPATRVAALISGELDLLLDPPIQDLPRIRATPGLRVQSKPQLRTIFLGLNTQGAGPGISTSDVNPLADRRIRRAIYHAIDSASLQEKIMRGNAWPTGLLIAPGIYGYSADLAKRLPYDLSAAKELLGAAGFEKGFGIQLDCPNNLYVNDEQICGALASMLAKIDIEVRLNAQPKSQFFKRIDSGESDFHLVSVGNVTLDSQENFKTLLKSDGVWNSAQYDNPDIDALIEQIESETDKTRRDDAIRKVWTAVRDDLPYIPLHQQVINWAVAENLSIPMSSHAIAKLYLARFINSQTP